MKILHNDWNDLLAGEFEKPYYTNLRNHLKEEYRSRVIYPDMHDIYSALHLTAYTDAKVVVIGQDPYHGAGQAHGLCFSVKPGVAKPPSLLNIFKELNADLGYPVPNHGYLVKWAEQGVLLMNTVLTVREGNPNSHKGIGWETFTDRIISLLNEREKPLVFILWGSHAQSKAQLISRDKHRIIASPHPSPLSSHRGFFGSRPFSKANDYLRSFGNDPIDWRIADMDISKYA